MNDTTSTNQTGTNQTGNTQQVPKGKLWVIGGLFLIAAIGMYAGTMYRIQNYGYVGVGNDQPIVAPDTQTKSN